LSKPLNHVSEVTGEDQCLTNRWGWRFD